MNNTITIKGQIYETSDYDKFSIMDKNRKINPSNLKKIVESMKEEQLIIPIIVNEKFEIIDGQHRFTAEKQLGLPVYYILNAGYGIEQVKRANTTGANWTVEDFLRSYSHNKNYNTLAELKKHYGLQLNVLLKIYAALTDTSLDIVKDKFKTGSFEITAIEEINITKFCEHMKIFKVYKGSKATAFILAVLKLYCYEDYDAGHMSKQVKKHMGNFNSLLKTQEAILEELCENVYSYRVSKPEQWIFYKKNKQRFHK